MRMRARGLQSPAEPRQRMALKFGRQKVNLRPTGSPGWATCKVDVPGSLDLCFIIEGSLKPIIEPASHCGGPGTPHRRSRAHDFLGRGEHESCQYPVWLHVRS